MVLLEWTLGMALVLLRLRQSLHLAAEEPLVLSCKGRGLGPAVL